MQWEGCSGPGYTDIIAKPVSHLFPHIWRIWYDVSLLQLKTTKSYTELVILNSWTTSMCCARSDSGTCKSVTSEWFLISERENRRRHGKKDKWKTAKDATGDWKVFKQQRKLRYQNNILFLPLYACWHLCVLILVTEYVSHLINDVSSPSYFLLNTASRNTNTLLVVDQVFTWCTTAKTPPVLKYSLTSKSPAYKLLFKY